MSTSTSKRVSLAGCSKLLASLMLIGLVFPQNVFAEIIDVTDKQGRTITAELTGYDGTKVEISRASDRRKFSIAVADQPPFPRPPVRLGQA